jgi:hypothetical protein
LGALAQHFVVLIRNAAEGVDVNRPAPTIGEQIARRGKRFFVMAITDSIPRKV